MFNARHLDFGRWVRWSVAATAAVMMVTGAGAASAAATTTARGAAYELMKDYMQQHDKSGFAKSVDLGSLKKYRDALVGVHLKVNANLDAVATYDPNTNTITFSKDPRKTTRSARAAVGETVWHEVTHALEDANADDFTNPDPNYQDRNTWYMKHVADAALPCLASMEKLAKKGASPAKLQAKWEKYLAAMEAAGRLPEIRGYPPDLALMRGWFGFKANPAEVKALYLSGKALPGKQGANLRKMLRAFGRSADATRSTITPLSSSIRVDGDPQVITVTARDASGTALGVGGASVTITRLSGTGTISAVADKGDGSYVATVTPPTTPGTGTFVATVNGTPVKGGAASQAQAVVNYTPGLAKASKSTLTPVSASIPASAGTQVLTVTARDNYGNPLATGGHRVTIMWASGTGSIGPVTDNRDGTYSATVIAPGATGSGVFVATLSGDPVKSGALSQTRSTVTYTAGLGVGQPHQGGIIGYILQPGDPGYVAGEMHGLIIARANQSESAAWSNITWTVIGPTAQGTAIGTGQANTTAIVNEVYVPAVLGATPTYCTDGAAYLCANLVEGGYDDWYLPSKDELHQLCLNRQANGMFGDYVSSTEEAAGNCWHEDFGTWQYATFKNSADSVRAVRSF